MAPRFQPFGYARIAAFAVVSCLLSCPNLAQAQNVLRVVLQEEPASLDPCDTNHSANSRLLRNNVTETLVNVGAVEAVIEPNLAISWEQTSPTTWRFKLRSGVRFHDGTPFTAAAVAAALQRAQVEALACAIRGSKLGNNPYTTRIVDDLTIDIIGRDPDPIVPFRMAVVDIGAPGATPADRKTQEPVGTGPYKFERWNRGRDVVFTLNDAYWGPKAAIPRVEFAWRGESTVRAAMVTRNEAHLAFGIAPQDATGPLDKTYLNAEVTFIRMDAEIPPLNDIRVRQAANLAIDRDQLIGSVFHKSVTKATQIVLPNVNGASPDLTPWRYDPAAARALLAAARADGVPVNTEIVLYGRLGLYPNSTESLEAIQAMLNAVGFRVRVEMMETSAWLRRLLRPFGSDRPVSMLQSQHDNAQGDAVFSIGPRFRSNGNQAMINDPLVDSLIDLGTRSTGTLRRNAFRLAFEYMEKDIVPYIPLFNMVGTVRVAANVNYTPDVQANNEIKLKTITLR
ncbi:MAG: ABC transporter substrate-binding protein [Telmatospirillum sp.]|nr:ABC transporter substrate-binding protein [Telmatospirillum sp.]